VSADPATDRPQTNGTADPPVFAATNDGELVTLREALAHAYDEVAYLREALRAEQERVREAHLLLAQRPALSAQLTALEAGVTNATHEPPPWWRRWVWW
jgi:hypothetical protein